MAKRSRRRSSTPTTDSGDSERSSDPLPPNTKKARIPAEVSNKDDATSSRLGGSESASNTNIAETAAAAKPAQYVKIFNMNVNGVMKAFARKDKRLDALLKDQGQWRFATGVDLIYRCYKCSADPDIVVLTEMHYDPQAPLKRKEDGMASYQRFKARYPVGSVIRDQGRNSIRTVHRY